MLASGPSAYPVCPECVSSFSPICGPRCSKCGISLVSEITICTRCRTSNFSFDSHRSLFAYHDPVKSLLAGLKFSGRTRLSRLFAELLSEPLGRLHAGSPLVPVPGRKKLDAVELIARSLQARYGVRVLRLLVRKGGRQQKTLDLEERRRNLSGRIALSALASNAAQQFPDEVVLLDDIFTTGATADACAKVLMAGGYRRVSVMTVAMEE
jgi:ComF family protein